jgi:hypothetical protein
MLTLKSTCKSGLLSESYFSMTRLQVHFHVLLSVNLLYKQVVARQESLICNIYRHDSRKTVVQSRKKLICSYKKSRQSSLTLYESYCKKISEKNSVIPAGRILLENFLIRGMLISIRRVGSIPNRTGTSQIPFLEPESSGIGHSTCHRS